MMGDARPSAWGIQALRRPPIDWRARDDADDAKASASLADKHAYHVEDLAREQNVVDRAYGVPRRPNPFHHLGTKLPRIDATNASKWPPPKLLSSESIRQHGWAHCGA